MKRLPCFLTAFLLLGPAAACESKSDCGGATDCLPLPTDGPPASFDATPVGQDSAAAAECPTEKLAFDQAHGCDGDDSVEFCVPADRPEYLAEIHAIAPAVTCAAGTGRAGCDSSTEVLCFFPASGEACVTPSNSSGPMTDLAWAQVCALASLPYVTEIVFTILE